MIDGTPVGIERHPPMILTTLGQLDTFPVLGTNPLVYLYLAQPGPFKRSWLQHTFADREMKGARASEFSWKVVVCGLHLDIIESVYARSAKLNASLAIQNGQHLKPIEMKVRELSEKHMVPTILLFKPVNQANQNGDSK